METPESQKRKDLNALSDYIEMQTKVFIPHAPKIYNLVVYGRLSEAHRIEFKKTGEVKDIEHYYNPYKRS